MALVMFAILLRNASKGEGPGEDFGDRIPGLRCGALCGKNRFVVMRALHGFVQLWMAGGWRCASEAFGSMSARAAG
jgi:hypothetical protein